MAGYLRDPKEALEDPTTTFKVQNTNRRGIEIIKLSPEAAAKVKAVDSICLEQVGAPPGTLQKAVPWNLPDDEYSQKYLYCLCKKIGIANDDGTFILDKTLRLFTNSTMWNDIKKAFSECNQLTGKSNYETLYKITDCFYSKVPVLLNL
ncbi:uncharacterized protein [Battus philenor]|uniref:uncharacterized protein n=1 Tax=Battus philenor TaxID=42288 RepID=UPI0035D0377C